jgi:hypothetical protein
MALFEIAGDSTEVFSELILSLGKIGLWLQAIGALVVITIIAIIINFVLNKKRLIRLNHIENKIDSIEDKLEKILKIKKRK